MPEAAITEVRVPPIALRRRVVDHIMTAASVATVLIVLAPLFAIFCLSCLSRRGIAQLGFSHADAEACW
jgi:hypothetical protein